MKKKGKLIVIDGTDGSGKATQTKLLFNRLKQEKVSVKSYDYPHYQDFFGAFIGECLSGKHGDFVKTDPYIASVLYAADRFDSSEKIKKWLDNGYVVILDRYVSGNQLHQGGKIVDQKKRKEFLLWLDTMEYRVFGLRRPDLILYLDVPFAMVQKLLKNKDLTAKKRYTKGNNDLVEKNEKYLRDAQKSALKIIKEQNRWKKIACAKNGKLLGREEIHEKIFNEVKHLIT